MLLRVAGEAARLMFLAERGKVRSCSRTYLQEGWLVAAVARCLALPTSLFLLALPTKHECLFVLKCYIRHGAELLPAWCCCLSARLCTAPCLCEVA
jgi:hypothetical protein